MLNVATGHKDPQNDLLVLVKLKSEHRVITQGDSDESFCILINSALLPSGFWHLDSPKTVKMMGTKIGL